MIPPAANRGTDRSPGKRNPRLAPAGGSRLRLAGGALKGRRLAVASGVRPTGSRLREALFSIWQARLKGCRFLDLFAGSGAVGLEAISRGAGRVVFAEAAPRTFEVLQKSVRAHAPERTRVLRARLPAGIDRLPDEPFDLIFADPPYAFSQHGALLRQVATRLAAGGEMAIEHSFRLRIAEPAAPWRRREKRCYGDSCLSFFVLDRPGAEAPRTLRP